MPASQEEHFRQLQAEMERRAHPPSENADDIDRRRPFTADLKVTLLGRDFPLRPGGGLITLFRYVSRGTQEQQDATARGMAQLAAMYDLLQDSVVASEWPKFEDHATSAKATAEDVDPCIRQLIEAYTARPYWAGLRLLSTAAEHMAELDGAVLMGTGRGIATFSAREVCNLMLYRLLASQPGDDERELFMEELYLDYSPTDIAMNQTLAMIEAKAKAKAEEAASGPAADEEPGAEGPEGLHLGPDGGSADDSAQEAQDGTGAATSADLDAEQRWNATAEDHGDSALEPAAG